MKTSYTSHRDDTKGGGKAPIQAHLATGPIDDLTPIPKGAYLYFIEDPRRADTIIQCIVEKVEFENHHLKGVRLVAYSKSWKTTRRLYLTAAWSGEHVSGLDEDQKQTDVKLTEQGVDVPVPKATQTQEEVDQVIKDRVAALVRAQVGK